MGGLEFGVLWFGARGIQQSWRDTVYRGTSRIRNSLPLVAAPVIAVLAHVAGALRPLVHAFPVHLVLLVLPLVPSTTTQG